MSFKNSILQEPTIFLSRKYWEFSRGMHKRLWLFVGMFIVANLISLLPPLMFGAFIREVQTFGITSASFPYLLFILSLLFFNEIVFWAFHGPARVIERAVAFWTEISYRKYLLGGVLDLGLTWHGEHDSGDTIDKVNKAGEGLRDFGKNIFQVLQLVVRLIGTTAVLVVFSPVIGGLVFVLVIFSFVAIFQFDRYLVPQYRQLNEFSNKAMARVFDALSNITSVKILHIESPVLDGILSRLRAPYYLYTRNSVLNESKWFTGALFYEAIAVVPIALYAYYSLASGKAVDAGALSTLYLYLSNMIYVYFGFTGFYQDLAIYKNQVLNVEPVEKAFLGKDAARRNTMGPWSTLTVANLSFAYEGAGELPNLNKISMHVRKGEKVALIGESGSGKTTFLKVLHGLYPKAAGRLVLDAAPGRATSFADIDLKTMLVPQEPEIFSSSIRENITLGLEEYGEDDIMRAAAIARFDTVVAELPRGLESVINEKGVNLSGGQKQRLALSRALLFSKDKELILLDESTSSVDSENEMEIYGNIWKAFEGKTVIASIHKMNLLKLFDRIYMFKKGSIVDEGTFDELLVKNASFKKSWDKFVTTHPEKERRAS